MKHHLDEEARHLLRRATSLPTEPGRDPHDRIAQLLVEVLDDLSEAMIHYGVAAGRDASTDVSGWEFCPRGARVGVKVLLDRSTAPPSVRAVRFEGDQAGADLPAFRPVYEYDRAMKALLGPATPTPTDPYLRRSVLTEFVAHLCAVMPG